MVGAAHLATATKGRITAEQRVADLTDLLRKVETADSDPLRPGDPTF